MVGGTKKKICWNCEGNVSVHEENCPYCAVYVGPAEPKEEVTTLAPPYQIYEKSEIPEAPYKSVSAPIEEQARVADTSPLRQLALPVTLLSGGAIFLLFGIMLWLFSYKGSLVLTWKSEYWYAYLLLGVPMLFWGWRSMKEEEPVR